MKRISLLLCALTIVSLSACSRTEVPEPEATNVGINIGVNGEAEKETQNSAINIQVKEPEAQQ